MDMDTRRTGAGTQPVTIYSIANELGISPSTVSRAFTKPDLVRDSVRVRILAKADDMGYSPNRAARGLASGRTGLVGLLVPDVTNPFFPPLVREIQRTLGVRDSEVVLINTGADPETELGVVRRLRPYVDGFIISSSMLPEEKLITVTGSRPSVLINREVEGFSSVTCDNSDALREAADHLAGLGHRRFQLMRGPDESWAARQRASAVRGWASKSGMELVELGPFQAQFEDGRAAAGAVVEGGATAILAFDDLMAAGLIAGLNDMGERVPVDRSIVGCDDVLLARTMTPSLTTVAAPVARLAEEAVRLLDSAAIRGPAEQVRLPGVFVPRQTTTRPRV